VLAHLSNAVGDKLVSMMHGEAEERRLAAAACDPAVSLARLALEHGINANLLFKWRRQYRQRPMRT
jgi:transposase-like protein